MKKKIFVNPRNLGQKIKKKPISTDSLKQTKDAFIKLLNNHSHIDRIALNKVKEIKASYKKMCDVIAPVRSAMK